MVKQHMVTGTQPRLPSGTATPTPKKMHHARYYMLHAEPARPHLNCGLAGNLLLTRILRWGPCDLISHPGSKPTVGIHGPRVSGSRFCACVQSACCKTRPPFSDTRSLHRRWLHRSSCNVCCIAAGSPKPAVASHQSLAKHSTPIQPHTHIHTLQHMLDMMEHLPISPTT